MYVNTTIFMHAYHCLRKMHSYSIITNSEMHYIHTTFVSPENHLKRLSYPTLALTELLHLIIDFST